MKKILAIFVMLFVLSLTSCGSNRFKKYDIMVNHMNSGTLKMEYIIEIKSENLEGKSYLDLYVPDAYNGIYDEFISLNDSCTNVTINDETIENNKIRYIRCDLSEDALKNKTININFTFEISSLYSYNDVKFSYKFYIPEECKNLYWKSRVTPEHVAGEICDGYIHWDNTSFSKVKYAFVQYQRKDYPGLPLHNIKIVEDVIINDYNLENEQGNIFFILLYSFLIFIPVMLIIIIITIIIRKKTVFGIVRTSRDRKIEIECEYRNHKKWFFFKK